MRALCCLCGPNGGLDMTPPSILAHTAPHRKSHDRVPDVEAADWVMRGWGGGGLSGPLTNSPPPPFLAPLNFAQRRSCCASTEIELCDELHRGQDGRRLGQQQRVSGPVRITSSAKVSLLLFRGGDVENPRDTSGVRQFGAPVDRQTANPRQRTRQRTRQTLGPREKESDQGWHQKYVRPAKSQGNTRCLTT